MFQSTLLGIGAPTIDSAFRGVERVWLDDDSWVDITRGWVSGSTALFDELRRDLNWVQERRQMYDRDVDVPRLTAQIQISRPAILDVMSDALSRRYQFAMNRISASLYRDGRDSVAWHRDRGIRELDEAVVGIVSLGGPRTLALRPLGGGRAAASISFGWGDLVVMGGASNREWEHSVPKCAGAQPRLALMFRHLPDRTGGT